MAWWAFVQDELSGVHRGEPAFVVGNGPLRLKHDLSVLQKAGVLIGCNAITEDVIPSYAVAVDGLASRLLWESDVCPVVTPRAHAPKRTVSSYRFRSVNYEVFQGRGYQLDVREHFLRGISGVIALQLAILLGCNPITLVGMEHTVEPGEPPSVYSSRGRPEYAKSRSFSQDGVVRLPGGLVPKQWLDSVRKLWWVVHLYAKDRDFFRSDPVGALDFLPVYGDGSTKEIPRPPGTSLREFVEHVRA